jgi:cytoskeletal protein RodZ
MPRKIYDIKPPKLARQVEEGLKEFLGEGKKKSRNSRRKKESHFKWLPVVLVVLLIIIIIGVYLFFKLPKANVQLWPKVDILSFQQTVIADKSISSVDLEKAFLPAQYFEASETASQDFPATGNASNEGRASGKITVYNKYDPVTPMTLKAGTHFMSDSGKLFVASQKIVVPAAKKSGSKITPGSIEVNVQAVEGGESYNIAPSNFSVPGLKGTAYYYSIYATSSSAMTGGYAGKVKKVTDDDIQSAKDIMTKQAADKAISSLKNQISSDFVLLDNAINSTTADASTLAKTGAVVDNFTYKATVKASAIAFKKSDIEKFAKDYIVSQLPQGQTILEGSFKVDYSASTVDISGGKATLNVTFSSGAYNAIDVNSTAISLMGKNASQVGQVIDSKFGDQINQVKVNFWPFWVTKAPNNQKAIKVELKFE